ncbi:MAG: hypothetical protein WDO06_02400 [Actinomycetota bacterium]
MRIETARLILRPLLESDLADLYEYQSDAQTVRYIPVAGSDFGSSEIRARKISSDSGFHA